MKDRRTAERADGNKRCYSLEIKAGNIFERHLHLQNVYNYE